MDLKSIWSVLEESSEVLFDNYGNPATGKAVQELSLPPDYFPWVVATWLFDANPFIEAKRNLYQRMGIFPTLEGFLGHCLELEGYCDDCYIATWRVCGVEGHTWELLDLLSRYESLTFADLHKELSGRGVTEEVHAADAMELERRGWADEVSKKIQITALGKRVRAEVEAETERIFFAPWSCLNESELEELASLASQLRDGLNPPENRAETGAK